MTKICDVLRKVTKTLIVILFAAVVIVTFAGVIARYILNNSIIWSEEFSRYVFNWVIMLACGLAVGSNSHMYIDVIYRVIPKRAHKAYQTVVDALVLVFFVFMIVYSVKLVIAAGAQVSADPHARGVLRYAPGLYADADLRHRTSGERHQGQERGRVGQV